ncbi:uncharacterized protein LOC106177657 [Lingula anatina]|uniref:Uncharacterized protein LOC106177657 n=1 Tax=Lingula anatina TaxID=7574 RepID=A0A1S3JZY0_LINAN|nr:uncharacterized protein LOC106177657 [Lingula anatina]|eukprot:XP_013415950.1 uncharacterized protein LOC106177657 [Lingula anatina]
MFTRMIRKPAVFSRLFSRLLDERPSLEKVVPLSRSLDQHRPESQRFFTSDREGSQEVTIRRGRMEDVPGVWKLTAEAKWNIHQDMIETHFKISENGWTVAEKEGDIVGCHLSHDFSDGLKTAGHFIVSSKLRGHGVGEYIIAISI